MSFMLIIARSRTLRWHIILLEDVIIFSRGSAAAVFGIVVLQKINSVCYVPYIIEIGQRL